MDRTIGVAVLVVGLLVLFGGLGWTYKQYQDEKDNDQHTPGPFTDPDETDENADSGMNALWVAAAGFIVAIAGVVLLSWADAAARRPERQPDHRSPPMCTDPYRWTSVQSVVRSG